nr:serine--tRNA ligase [Anaerolinea sp.]
MLDINLFRETPDLIRQALTRRRMDPAIVERVLSLDADRRAVIARG